MTTPLRVLLVTSWAEPCGIAEHSAQLKAAVEVADPAIAVEPRADALDPARLITRPSDLVHLNYHAALHSRWTPEAIRALQDRGVRVIVTYHDTGVPNTDQCKGVCAAADAVVVHEPCADLPETVHYWRMGVADWPRLSTVFDRAHDSWVGARPVLGSIGFPFPWKNYDSLAVITGKVGWALLLIAPGATADQIATWRQHNSHLQVVTDFPDRAWALALLAACDATAFCYTCQNGGQSAAILQGIAARKPVVAFHTCRQFRALAHDPLAVLTIRWAETFKDLEEQLLLMPLGQIDAGMVALAEQESWAKLGAKYAGLYREVDSR